MPPKVKVACPAKEAVADADTTVIILPYFALLATRSNLLLFVFSITDVHPPSNNSILPEPVLFIFNWPTVPET